MLHLDYFFDGPTSTAYVTSVIQAASFINAFIYFALARTCVVSVQETTKTSQCAFTIVYIN